MLEGFLLILLLAGGGGGPQKRFSEVGIEKGTGVRVDGSDTDDRGASF